MVSRRGLTRAFSKRFRKTQRAQRLRGIRDARYITHARDDSANFLYNTRPKGMGRAWDEGFKKAYLSHQSANTPWWKSSTTGKFKPRGIGGGYDAAKHPRDWMGRFRRK